MTGSRTPPTAQREPDPVLALLTAHGHGALPAAAVQFSYAEVPSFVGLREPGGPTVPLVSFLPLPGTGAGVLDALAGLDDSGARLVERFRRDFPDTVQRLTAVDCGSAATPAMSWLLGMCSLSMDLGAEDVRRAMHADGGGVRVDTVVVEDGDGYVVDGRRLLRSVISYRVAGVAAHVLARSVFTSLGEFTGDAVRRLVRAWPSAQVIVCAGDLFGSNIVLRNQARRSLVGLRLPVLLP